MTRRTLNLTVLDSGLHSDRRSFDILLRQAKSWAELGTWTMTAEHETTLLHSLLATDHKTAHTVHVLQTKKQSEHEAMI